MYQVSNPIAGGIVGKKGCLIVPGYQSCWWEVCFSLHCCIHRRLPHPPRCRSSESHLYCVKGNQTNRNTKTRRTLCTFVLVYAFTLLYNVHVMHMYESIHYSIIRHNTKQNNCLLNYQHMAIQDNLQDKRKLIFNYYLYHRLSLCFDVGGPPGKKGMNGTSLSKMIARQALSQHSSRNRWNFSGHWFSFSC